jgi:hypothetical protein
LISRFEAIASRTASSLSIPAALLAVVCLAFVLADARPAALLAAASLAVVLADARPAALLALASLAVVLADAWAAALLAPAFMQLRSQMPIICTSLQSLKIRRCSHVLDPSH